MSEISQVVTNDRGRFLHQSQRFCEIVGLSPGELHALGWEDVVHPEDWVVIAGAMLQVLDDERGESTEAMIRILRPEGSALWTHVSMVRGISDDGTVTMTSGLQPFTALFPESEHKGIELILGALVMARADREAVYDALEDCRSRTARMAGAFAAMAGIAQDRQSDPDADTAELARRDRTMQGAQEIAHSVQGEMPELNRRPSLY